MNKEEIDVLVGRLTQAQRMTMAKACLNKVSENWKEEDVSVYDSSMSFDELAAEVSAVELKGEF